MTDRHDGSVLHDRRARSRAFAHVCSTLTAVRLLALRDIKTKIAYDFDTATLDYLIYQMDRTACRETLSEPTWGSMRHSNLFHHSIQIIQMHSGRLAALFSCRDRRVHCSLISHGALHGYRRLMNAERTDSLRRVHQRTCTARHKEQHSNGSVERDVLGRLRFPLLRLITGLSRAWLAFVALKLVGAVLNLHSTRRRNR